MPAGPSLRHLRAGSGHLNDRRYPRSRESTPDVGRSRTEIAHVSHLRRGRQSQFVAYRNLTNALALFQAPRGFLFPVVVADSVWQAAKLTWTVSPHQQRREVLVLASPASDDLGPTATRLSGPCDLRSFFSLPISHGQALLQALALRCLVLF